MIAGNMIGTNAAVTGALTNTEYGVRFENGASNNTVGGTASGARNIISGNGLAGVYLAGGPTINNVVQGNYIGTNATGTAAIANLKYGVFLVGGAQNNTIGGTVAAARNIISGNAAEGVYLSGSPSNIVEGNYIGTDVTGTAKLANAGYGVFITGASSNTIGGTAAGAGNVISGNGKAGVYVGPGSNGNVIAGNKIGTNAAGTGALGNTAQGVLIGGATNTSVGGTAAGAGNTIAFNGSTGVAIQSGTGNSVLSDYIFSNGLLGIDLGTIGVTGNDAGDGDTGANNLQNFPVLSSAVNSGGTTTVMGTLNSLASKTFTIQFFGNDSLDSTNQGEGQVYLGSKTVTTDASGNVSFTFTTTLAAAAKNKFITATATDSGNNTSEFSLGLIVS